MKISKKLVDATLATGLPPIDMRFYPCDDQSGRTVAYYAMQIINSVEFGVLTPADFRVVAGRTNQAVRLAEKALDKTMLELRRREITTGDYDYVMVEVPRRMLEDGSLLDDLEGRMASGDFTVRGRLCVLFSAEVLLTDPEKTVPRLEELLSLGIHIGLTDFGDESTATLRLPLFPFEVVVLDPSVSKLLGEGMERALGAVVGFAEGVGASVYMQGELTEDQRARAFAAGVRGVFTPNVIYREEVKSDA